jgi:hypothetical protein
MYDPAAAPARLRVVSKDVISLRAMMEKIDSGVQTY